MIARDHTRWFLSRLRHVTRASQDRAWLGVGRFALPSAHRRGLARKPDPDARDDWHRLGSCPGFPGARRAESESDAKA